MSSCLETVYAQACNQHLRKVKKANLHKLVIGNVFQAVIQAHGDGLRLPRAVVLSGTAGQATTDYITNTIQCGVHKQHMQNLTFVALAETLGVPCWMMLGFVTACNLLRSHDLCA